MRLASEHVPAAAWAAPQSGTDASRPVRPGGRSRLMRPSAWLPSGRRSVIVKPPLSPAIATGTPPTNVGLKPAPQLPLTLNVLVTETGVALLYGFSAAVVVAGPHVVGVASGARAPPLNWSVNRVNGSSGLSVNEVTSFPVCGSGLTEPRIFSVKFGPCPTRNSRYVLPGTGVPRKISPSTGSANSGVSNATVPIFEAFGQCAGELWSPSCASEQP